jgi:hypothetical protein
VLNTSNYCQEDLAGRVWASAASVQTAAWVLVVIDLVAGAHLDTICLQHIALFEVLYYARWMWDSQLGWVFKCHTHNADHPLALRSAPTVWVASAPSQL